MSGGNLVLCIGGPLDGEFRPDIGPILEVHTASALKIQWAGGANDTLVPPADIRIFTYTRCIFDAVDGRPVVLYLAEGVSPWEAMHRLVQGYAELQEIRGRWSAKEDV